MRVYPIVKCIFDFIFSFIAIIVLSPLLLAIAIGIKLDCKGPVFFRQKRIGKYKKVFHILKFRTMTTDTPPNIPTHMLKTPDKFITKFGKFLRRTSLDELPQVFNILRGDMSIIGPRPALWNQCDLISARDKYGANDINPGLTGWAQVNGRDELPIDIKAKMDGEYVQRMGFGLDVKCFFATIISVIKKDGVVEGGTTTLRIKENETSKARISI